MVILKGFSCKEKQCTFAATDRSLMTDHNSEKHRCCTGPEKSVPDESVKSEGTPDFEIADLKQPSGFQDPFRKNRTDHATVQDYFGQGFKPDPRALVGPEVTMTLNDLKRPEYYRYDAQPAHQLSQNRKAIMDASYRPDHLLGRFFAPEHRPEAPGLTIQNYWPKPETSRTQPLPETITSSKYFRSESEVFRGASGHPVEGFVGDDGDDGDNDDDVDDDSSGFDAEDVADDEDFRRQSCSSTQGFSGAGNLRKPEKSAQSGNLGMGPDVVKKDLDSKDSYHCWFCTLTFPDIDVLNQHVHAEHYRGRDLLRPGSNPEPKQDAETTKREFFCGICQKQLANR